jgi:hypothetical protein
MGIVYQKSKKEKKNGALFSLAFLLLGAGFLRLFLHINDDLASVFAAI